jgi:hypothetical protein
MAKKKSEAGKQLMVEYTKHAAYDDPNSCFNAAYDDEPIFILRANDETAPHLVRAWAEKYHAAKGRGMSGNARQLAKYNEAYAIARAMETWRDEQGFNMQPPLPDVEEDDGA